jgi:DNA polymerase-1
LDERKYGHGLKALADDYFDIGDYEHKLDDYLRTKGGRWSQVPREVLYRYNAMDTEITLRLAYVLEEHLKVKSLYEYPFKKVLMRAVEMLQAAEVKGVYIDWEENYRIEQEELLDAIQVAEQRLKDISGHEDLNPNSPTQIIPILFDELGFPEIEARTRAGGHRVTGRTSQKAMLDAWMKRYERGELKIDAVAIEFLEKLIEYRHLKKLYGSYIKKWRQHRGTDDRVHTTFKMWGTVTGRLSSTDPPMQTIPSKVTDHWGPLVANMHKPEPGNCFLYADYSQAELMIAAGLSGDEFMTSTFQDEGADYHSRVAKMAFGEDFTRDDRQKGKKLTFGWLYGGQVRGIALDALQFTPEVADHFAHRWDNMFEGVVQWRKDQQKKMREQGYVESVYGRRRRYLLLTEKNVGKAERVAVNSPIQSAASDFTLMSATRLYERYKDDPEVHVVLLIHDSVIMEVAEHRAEEVKEVMHDTMLDVPKQFFPNIPFQADVKKGYQLGDLT